MTPQTPKPETDLLARLPAPLFISPEPFSPHHVQAQAPHGATVVRLLAEAVNAGHLPLAHVHLVRTYVNGQELPRETALDYVVQQGDVINLVVAPQGGETGRTIFQIFYTIGAAIVGFTFGPGWGAVVAIAGQVVSSLIWRPQKPESLERSASGALSDAANQYRRRGMMPLALGGGRRVAPDVCALAYTQTVGSDVWLHVAFGWHYGPVQLDALKIGETLLAEYPEADVQVEHFLTPGPRESTLYPNRVVQENLQDQLDLGSAEWEVHTTAPDCDRVELDFTWPQGLNFRKDNGKILPQETQLLVEYSPAGEGNWQPAPLPPAQNRLGQALPPGSIYVQARSADPVRHTTGWDLDVQQQLDIRVRAWDPDGDDPDQATQQVLWTAVRTIENGRPVLDENLAVTFLRIKSSDDLNGSLPTVSGIPTPICPVWNGADWETEAPTSNAAALARWLVTGPCQAAPWTADQVDASCSRAFEIIEERGWHGAYYVQDEISLEDALLALARMGRFGLYWSGEALCFVPDWEKPFARQVFAGRNAAAYRYRREFPEPIHAIFVEFQNLDEDSRGDELTVYADGYDETNAQLIESLRLDFACTAERAFREGRVYLARRLLQVEIHEWQAGVDSVVSTYGDRVRVRHPTALYGEADARVTLRRIAGGLVTAIRLDDPVMITAGVDYALDVRRGDGTVLQGLEVSAAPGLQSELTLAAPLAVDIAPEPGDLVVFGRVGVITEDLEIIDIDPGDGFTAQIRAQRYLAAEIEAAETGPIPPLNTVLTPQQGVPKPRILGASGSPDGVVVSYDIDPTRAMLVQGFNVRWRRSPVAGEQPGDFQPLPSLPPSARSARTPPITDAQPNDGEEFRVDVEVRTVAVSGDTSDWARASNVLVNRLVDAPQDFDAEGVKRTAPDGSAYGALYVSARALDPGPVQDLQVQIRKLGTGDAGWRSAGPPLPSTDPRGDFQDVDPGQAYDVRGRWRTVDGWTSAWALKENVTVPAGSRISYAAATIGGLTPEELQEALEAASSLGSELTDRLRDLAMASLYHSTRIDEDVRYIDHLAHLDGQEIGTVLVQEREQRQTADEAFATIFDLIGAVVGDFEAFALNELLVQVRPGESLASWRDSLEVANSTALGLITDEAEARLTADDVFLRWFSFLGAERPGQDGWSLSESEVFLEDGSSFATYRSQVAAQYGDALVAISNETIARISGEAATASQISTLEVQVAGFSGSITTLLSVTSGLGAEATLALNVNGHVAGYRFFNTGTTSSLIFSAAEIGFSNGATTRYPLAIVDGVVRATDFEVDRVKAGSIVTASIQAGNITETTIGNVAFGAQLLGGGNIMGSMNFSCIGSVSVSIKGNISTTDSIGVAIRYEIHGGSGLVYASPEWGDYIFAGTMGGLNTVSLDEYISLAAGSYTIIVYGRRGGGGGTLINNRLLVTIVDFKTE